MTTDTLPPHLARHVSPETQYLRLHAPIALESGEVLEDVVVAYRTWGDQANASTRTVLVCHALTGSADVDAWWPGLIGTGCAFDPVEDFIVCANILGSCYGTTGPATLKPGSNERYRADFPRISVRDMVEVQRALMDELGIERIDLVTGPSLGGMQALEWATMFPERVGSVVPIGVGGRHSAWCIGVSEAQRAAIAADPNWKDGYYSDEAPPELGLSAARMMAICTYRSWQSFDERFGRDTGERGFEVQSYLAHQGTKINGRFDANTYVTLTHAMHTHDLARDRGDYSDVLRGIEHPALVESVSNHAINQPHEKALLDEHLPNAEYTTLESAHGHDGFLIETEVLGGLIRAFRESLFPSVGALSPAVR